MDKDKLWDGSLPQPAEIYKKGDFKGMFFCRFDSVEDRDKVVDNIRRLVLKIEDDKIWSNPDLPNEVRVPENFLFALKLLGSAEWGYTLQNLWVDKTKKSISLGKEMILSITMENLDMKLNFGRLWEDHLGGDDEFKKILKIAHDKLAEHPSKGDGKGKKGKAGL